MKTYFSSGIEKDIPYLMDSSEFCIQDIGSEHSSRYIYSGDHIKYDLDKELSKLYETFQNLYFENSESYYNDLYSLPIFIQEVGLNSLYDMDVDMFQKSIAKASNNYSKIYKYLYLMDCQFLIATVQNLFIGMEYAFINYYILLTSLDLKTTIKEGDEMVWITSEITHHTASMLEVYFTKAYSILDMMCKICFEIQNKNENFDSYKKIRSSNKLWGDRNRILIKNPQNTLFESCNLIRMIESLRNEVVHNGSWEFNPKIFVHFNNNDIKERFMLFPDMIDGRLANIKGRKHFFSNKIKVNDILPEIHNEFMKRLLNTIVLLNSKELQNENNQN